MRDEVERLLRVLDDRERAVVRRYHGLDGSKRQTLAEIAPSLGVTPQRASMLYRRALDELRQAAETVADN